MLPLLLVAAAAAPLEPKAAAELVADHIVKITWPDCVCHLAALALPNHTEQCLRHDFPRNAAPCAFGDYEYGPAIILLGLMEAAGEYKKAAYARFAGEKMGTFVETRGELAYNLSRGLPLAEQRSIGDRVGLFPLAFFEAGRAGPGRAMAIETVEKYILKWPHRLEDGTVSRTYGWKDGGESGGFLWADDFYMGLALPARLVREGRLEEGRKAEYVKFLAAQHRQFTERLQDRADRPIERGDDLYFHGYHAESGHHSCCKWGRANGWVMMGHVEVLSALQSAGAESEFERVLQVLRSHAGAVARLQSRGDGRWRQLLNESGSFLETSASAMFLWSLLKALAAGWLPRESFEPVARRAWRGLQRTISREDGTVSGICAGLGIGKTREHYEKARTDYLDSAPGLGSVLRAANAAHLYFGEGGVTPLIFT